MIREAQEKEERGRETTEGCKEGERKAQETDY